MKSFRNFITENRNLALQISDVIYRFTSGLLYGDDRVQCHESVNRVKNEGQELQVGKFRFHAILSFIEWDESKWDLFEKVVKSDTSWKKINIKEFQNLVMDISDGSVNGHSFIKVFDYYIDPYFNSAGLSFQEIQKSCKWFAKIYKKMGIV